MFSCKIDLSHLLVNNELVNFTFAAPTAVSIPHQRDRGNTTREKLNNTSKAKQMETN